MTLVQSNMKNISELQNGLKLCSNCNRMNKANKENIIMSRKNNGIISFLILSLLVTRYGLYW
jgi:hypothetical protein